MNNRQRLVIDSSKGGNGDIWMRLISFYVVAGITTEYEINLLIPGFLIKLATCAFGDRLAFITESEIGEVELSYTNLGMRDLIKGIRQGKKFISPYQRSVINDKKNPQFKDTVNKALFTLADFLGVVQVPGWEWLISYQGYLDIVGIKKLRKISYEQYISQLEIDYNLIYSKLNAEIPTSIELTIPEDIKEKVIVFPTGTSRQFVPVWWAGEYLPDAYYAFFHKDKEADNFRKAGLKTVDFFREPGDIIALSRSAKWTVSTDSFPSHLLQYASKRCSITITEVLRSRIISPAFKGKVIDSQVTCHPCLHLDRTNHPLCAAGYTECQNWSNKKYTNDLLNSICD